MTTRTPAEVFAPGEFLTEELDARGWTQEDLSRILGKPLPTINKIIKGKTSITADTAKKLGAAFGTSAELWMNLESAWRLHLSKEDTSGVEERAKIYDLAPVREMVRRGWIEKPSTPEALVTELCRHFGVSDLSGIPELQAAARAANRGESGKITAAQWAWVCRCRKVSSLVDADRFRKSDLKEVASQLVALSSSPEEVRRVPRMLAECGVRIVLVRQLKGTALDGGALHRNQREPVVGLTLRYGRLDNFWFTLMHELAHIINGDGVVADSDVGLQGEHVDAIEARANRTAAAWLVPQDALDSFVRRTTPLYRKILNFAKRVGVHPSLVVGQLKFRGEVEWEKFNRMNVDIRDAARASLINDGWDGPAPVDKE